MAGRAMSMRDVKKRFEQNKPHNSNKGGINEDGSNGKRAKRGGNIAGGRIKYKGQLKRSGGGMAS